MIAWGDVLSVDQIQEMVELIRQFEASPVTGQPAPEGVSFSSDVMPIFEADCAACHGNFGGWDASSYTAVIESGDNGPAVIPGDAENSLLAQKLLDTQEVGDKMPPMGTIEEADIQVILDWIAAGAQDN